MMRQTVPATTRLFELAGRVLAEYREMPDLALSHREACRLWGLDADTCQAVLAHMVERNVLRCTSRGAFVLC